jgi:murein DD-endopeptidase MepM/ murein hydrolase activator NlpD
MMHAITTESSKQTKSLLLSAFTMEGEYRYTYETITHTSTDSSACGPLTTTVTGQQLSSIQSNVEEWEPLRELLIEEGVTRVQDQDFLLEYWLGFIGGQEEGSSSSTWQPRTIKELLWPIQGKGVVSSPFGSRIDPITHQQRLHAGVDIAAKEGTPIVAVKQGIAMFAGTMGTAGNAVILRHEDRMETRYYHMNKILVTLGQDVQPGDVIGEVGTTGNSTGPHVHFEIRVNDQPVDPFIYYQ